MDFNGDTALIGILLVVGVVLIALPVLVPPDVPNDRVEYYVEGDWMDNEDQPNLVYANLTEAEREVFEEARRTNENTSSGTPVNFSVDEAPESLTPSPDGISIYNVRYENEWYLLQVRHRTYEADFATQHLPRLGAMALGAVCLVGAAYRRFAV
ncbi:hypothetical protein [Halapricum hydrolyticum]|uniref:DUF7979 domain-containing protein n=1 Tax=Halapricum hydrolyticum TaxID=2979991 RepID=A0AAE3I922_9EURY|nr:hypothetical protein [Halapricum hydrolyticum]MCU4717154.1 hypothetical protein [Halapricum hydrolyticum]MCU4726081.1 hypothetical protein [Halapricum hydrolyticum]